MTEREAIVRADAYRPNKIEDEIKADWLYRLDCRLAKEMEMPAPIKVWPDDRELLVGTPFDDIYMFWLASQIDIQLEEMQRYANDLVLYNSAHADLMTDWIHDHIPSGAQQLKVM